MKEKDWELRRYGRSEHCVSRKEISTNALKVLYRLNNSGYRACLVGGAVRDILLGKHPKDFDIATDAKPEEVKNLFRNSRLIGRRFRLAHILFGREIVEVATFRGHHEDDSQHGHVEEGRIIRDNVYGDIEEDALRRDFTINALFYDINNFEVLDYCNAMSDIETRTLRLIGDPDVRYREDPVRMLRAIRLAQKLDLNIAPETSAPIQELAPLLGDMSGARLWDESHKLFLAGHAQKTFDALEEYHLLSSILPQTQQQLELSPQCKGFISKALENTDQRIQQSKPLNPGFLYACFLWHPVLWQQSQYQTQGYSPAEAMQRAIVKVLAKQVEAISIPRRFSQFIREVWLLQHRLVSRRGKKLFSLLEHPRFRAAYDFLLLRSEVGEVDPEIGKWWTEVQAMTGEQQQTHLAQLRGPKKRRKPRNRKPNA